MRDIVRSLSMPALLLLAPLLLLLSFRRSLSSREMLDHQHMPAATAGMRSSSATLCQTDRTKCCCCCYCCCCFCCCCCCSSRILRSSQGRSSNCFRCCSSRCCSAHSCMNKPTNTNSTKYEVTWDQNHAGKTAHNNYVVLHPTTAAAVKSNSSSGYEDRFQAGCMLTLSG